MKAIVRYIVLFFALGIVFFLFNLLSAWVPNTNIKKQLDIDLEYYNTLGDYDRPILDKHAYTFDYFTDALILNVALSVDNHRPLEASLTNAFYDKLDVDKNTRWLYVKRLANAKNLTDTDPYYRIYARYWFGAAYLYRFLFLFIDYSSLRIVLYLVTSILLFVFLMRQYKLSHWSVALSFLMGLLLVNLMFMQYLIQFSSVLIISLAIAIAVQGRFIKTKHQDIGLLFLLSGALTAYLDLLTAPLLSLGFPLLVWLQLHLSQHPKDIKNTWKHIFLFSVLWAAAYFGLFIFKWIIVALFTDIDIVDHVQSAALYRIGVESTNSKSLAITQNFNNLDHVILSVTMLLTIVYSALDFSMAKVKHTLLYLFVALMPFIWMFVINEHSESHYWFAYRILAVSITAVLLMILNFRRVH